MAGLTKQFAGDFALKKVELYPLTGESAGKAVDIRELVQELSLYESIVTTSLTAELVIADVAKNIISNYPLVGQEKVVIEIGSGDKIYKLPYHIFRIDSRVLSEKQQAYIIHLMSFEGMANEIVRVSERIDGKKPEEAIKDLIAERLRSKKKVFSDESLYPIDMVVPNWRIFDLSVWLGKRTSSTKHPDSVGYLFYETFDGYNFYSIDELIKKQAVNAGRPYTYVQGNLPGNNPELESRRIKQFSSTAVFDILEDVRMGALSHTEIRLDFNNRKKKIYKNSVDTFYESSEHLGTTRPYHSGPLKLNVNPSRVIYRPMLNQIWGKDLSEENNDKLNEAFSKALFRYHFLDYNKLHISIPGNMDLRAGNTLEVSIPSPEKKEDNKRAEDKRLTGKYIIHSMKHTILNRTELSTYITLTRDSFGGKNISDPDYNPDNTEITIIGNNGL
jgi:hypothetical protein